MNDLNEAPTAILLSNDDVDENTDTTGGYTIGTLSTQDPDAGDTASYEIIGGPDQSKLSLSGNNLILSDGVLDHESQASYSATIRVTDSGGATRSQSFNILVNDLNEAPVIESAALSSATEDALYSYTLSASDQDGNPLSFSAPTLPGWLNLVDNNDGTATLSGTPLNADVGDHSVVIEVSDGLLSDTQSFTVSVANTNDAPVFTSSASFSAPENQTAVGIVSSVDDDLDTVTYSISGGTDASLFSIDPNTGVLRFVDAPNFESPGDTGGDGNYQVEVTAADPNGGSTAQMIGVSLTDANDAPTAANSAFTTAEDTLISDALPTATDEDADSVSYQLDAGPSQGILNLGGDGSFSYTPAADFHGADSFSYRVADPDGAFNTYTATITVTPVNDAPQSGGPIDLGSIPEDSSRLITQAELLAGSSDVDGDTLQVRNVSADAGQLLDNLDGTWSFTPAANWYGSVAFSFDINDGTADTPGSAQLAVAPIQDAPSAAADQYTMLAGNTLLGSGLLSNDQDVDGDALSVDPSPAVDAQNGTLQLNGDGSFSYTPNGNFYGTDSFSYRISDGNGNTAVAEVTINVDLVDISTPTPPQPEGEQGGEASGDLGGDPGNEHTPQQAPPDNEPTEEDQQTFEVSEDENTPEEAADPSTPDADDSAEQLAAEAPDSAQLPVDRSAAASPGTGNSFATPDVGALANQLYIRLLGTAVGVEIADIATVNQGPGPDAIDYNDQRSMEEALDRLVEQIARNDGDLEQFETLSVEAAGMALSLTAGVVIWVLRTGSLAASLISVLPVWQNIDPLPVLSSDTSLLDTDFDLLDQPYELDLTVKGENLFNEPKAGER